MSLRTVGAGLFCGLTSGVLGLASGFEFGLGHYAAANSVLTWLVVVLLAISGWALLAASLRRGGKTWQPAMIRALMVSGVALGVLFVVGWRLGVNMASQLVGL